MRPGMFARQLFGIALFTAILMPDSSATAHAAPAGDDDPPEVKAGERLFLETRFAQFFWKNAKDMNTPLAAGDPVVETTQTTGAPLTGPMKGYSINCRACHLVDEHNDVRGAGMRTYADFARRSPVPGRGDGRKVTLRNSPSQVNVSIDRELPFFHFDGEFVAMEDLAKMTFTGRNFGWLPGEERTALAHLARVIREDKGTFPYPPPNDVGGSYASVFKGTDPKIPLPYEYRLEVGAASDIEILEMVAKLVAIYVKSLQFSREKDAYNGSPYDLFLKNNGLPTMPSAGETPLEYSRRLARLLENGKEWKYVTQKESGKMFRFHKQEFAFGEPELAGLKIFLREPIPKKRTPVGVGNCVACHQAPHFSDFAFHNTGVSQDEYDSVHGTAAFLKVQIPDEHLRKKNYRLYLPVQAGHLTNDSGPFAEIPSKDKPGHCDLGLWNVFLNPSFPRPQDALLKQLRKQNPGVTDPEELLRKTIASFKTPVLRDLGHSAPYMHSGRFDDFDSAVRFYLTTSALARVGGIRNADPELRRIFLAPGDVPNLVAFLRSLNEDYE